MKLVLFPELNQEEIFILKMESNTCLILGILAVLLYTSLAHPGRPSLPDSPEARHIFELAEENRTRDGYITHEEIQDIFADFDVDGDGYVGQSEFLQVWKEKHLGDEEAAINLFHNADTDKDNLISRVPDLSRVFYYFDRNGSLF